MTVRRLVGIVILLSALVGAAAAFFLWPDRHLAMVRLFMRPRQPFASTEPPPSQDYAAPAAWLRIPAALDKPADVFFVHPTTYMSADAWNQPPGHEKAERFLTRSVLPGQAAIFEECCDLYAPRYRQATLYSFFDDGDDGPSALDLAYGDVLAAFEVYLAAHNHGRPFVLAGHSQGSFHALRLLEERIAGREEQNRLVAAYLVGVPLPTDKLAHSLAGIPVCDGPQRTGCVISWNAVGDRWGPETVFDGLRVHGPEGYRSVGGREVVCVNPLNWTANDTPAPPGENRGALPFPDPDRPPDEPEPGVTGATCRDGMLWIDRPENDAYRRLRLEEGSYHLVDYNLFHVNVRENAVDRVRRFVTERSAPNVGDRLP